MPNQHGGKAYKKGSKKKIQQQAVQATRFNGRDEGQDYARVTRMLGNRRVLCFCNDGVERVGKIRGSLCKGPKRQKIEEGDIVITSSRSFDGSSDSESGDEDVIQHVAGGTSNTATAAITATGRKEIVDILEKVAQTHWRQLRKEGGIHKDLLPNSGDTLDDIFEPKTEEKVEGDSSDSDIDIADI